MLVGDGDVVPSGLLYTLAAVEKSPGKPVEHLHDDRVLGVGHPVGLDAREGEGLPELPGFQVVGQGLEPAPVALGGPEILPLVTTDPLPALDRQHPAHREGHEEEGEQPVDPPPAADVLAGSRDLGGHDPRASAAKPKARDWGRAEVISNRTRRPLPGPRGCGEARHLPAGAVAALGPADLAAVDQHPQHDGAVAPLAAPHVVQAGAHRQLLAQRDALVFDGHGGVAHGQVQQAQPEACRRSRARVAARS